MQAMRERGARYLDLAGRLSRPDRAVPAAPRPAPSPPAEARPRRLSVTRIETLIRDAYAIYAEKVLNLRPLEPLGRPADARERGTVVHTLMERFTERTIPWRGIEEAREILMATADEVLAKAVPWPDLRRTWRARVGRFADWYLAQEEARRQAAQPVARERKGLMTIDLAGGPFEITARADRIDRLPDGSAAIYDYKTGAPPKKPVIDAGFAQQIHLQAAILAAGGFEGLPVMETGCGGYIGLTGSGDGGAETMLDDVAAEVAAHMEGVRKLLAAHDAGAPYVSLGRPQLAREEHDYDHLARRAEWWGDDA